MAEKACVCPICGFVATDHRGRTCPVCGYRGDWIQPGRNHLFRCEKARHETGHCICKRLALEMHKKGL